MMCPICKERLRTTGENVCTICFMSTDKEVIKERCYLKVEEMLCSEFVDTVCHVYDGDPKVDSYPMTNILEEGVRMNRAIAWAYRLREPGTIAEKTGLEGLKIARTGKRFGLNSSYNVLHKCNIKRCINHNHLIVGTHSQNILQVYCDGILSQVGEKNPNTGLTDEIVMLLRPMSVEKIMAYTSLSHSQATKIGYGRAWDHLPPLSRSELEGKDPRYKATTDELRGYRERLENGENPNILEQEMINRYGYNPKTVRRLLQGKQRPERKKEMEQEFKVQNDHRTLAEQINDDIEEKIEKDITEMMKELNRGRNQKPVKR